MDNAIIQALRRAKQAYMTNVGEPTAQLVGGGVRGYLGLDAPEYADSRGMEAYRNAAAISNTPVVGMPSMAVRAGAKAAPAIAQSLREHAKGFQEYNRALGPAGASQMVVWHGSPHKFDAFDSSKIGTGEGSQAYGHGLYLAESPDVAGSYRIAGGHGNWLIDGNSAAATTVRSDSGPMNYAADALQRFDGDRQQAMKWLRNWGMEGEAKKILRKAKDVKKSDGSLYKVDLPDEKIARMLDWDKPLSQQAPEVQKAIRAQMPDSSWEIMKSRKGQDYVEDYWGAGIGGSGQPTMASGEIKKLGIPGIRYLDASSRGAGQGTSNFVVFPGEEAALTILERNNEIINALRKKKQQ